MADPLAPPAAADGTVPAGFPDAAALERMANAFFRALPGSAPARTEGGIAAAPPPGGAGFAPPSVPVSASPVPAAPPVAAAPVSVPAVPAAAPFGGIPALPDPHLRLPAGAEGRRGGPLYVAGIAAARPAFDPATVPALDETVPQGDVLRQLLAGRTASPRAPASFGAEASVPYFLKAAPVAATPRTAAGGGFDAARIRREFPILSEKVEGKPLVWLDNAATTHKPRAVIERLTHFYEHENSNIHRAAHTLAGRATDAYEAAREQVRRFVNAASVDEIVFVRGTTEAINLMADTWGRANIGAGDEIVVTWLEHHANIVPWHRLAKEKGAVLRVAPVDDNGDVILEDYARLLGPRTKLVSLTQVSNALGTVTPAQLMVAMAHAAGAKVLVDGAQSVSHMRTDVRALDADWFVFSGHKIYGPTGIGTLYGRKHVLDSMPPYQSGGNMIADVTFEHIRYQPAPTLFEAGTGNIADAVGLGAALAWLEAQGIEAAAAHEHALIEHCLRRLSPLPGVRIVGHPRHRAGVVSFVIDGMKTEEVGTALSKDGIAVRSGHHCAQPILRRFGLESSVRPSFAIYNTFDDIDALAHSVRRIEKAGA